MFIGRKYELQELNTLYEKDSFQMPVIYGRRRVGKSTLIREFVKDKKCIFYTAIESSAQRNLELFSQTVYRTLDMEMAGLPGFASFDAAFSYIAKKAVEERLILVIDEYPYLASSDKSISSLLQKYIDETFLNGKLFLILCGSSMSFMKHQVLGYQSPLYGRRTAQFLIRPFNYQTSGEFVKEYSCEDKAVVYGITGGIPKYLELFDSKKSLRDNIIDLFLKENGYLFEEPSNLLKQELRDSSRYNSIIEVIAKGANKVSEIASKTQLETSTVAHCLDSLMELGIVSRENAMTEENNKKKTFYRLEDSMFRFWYRFVPSGMDAILGQNGDYLYDEFIEKELPDYMERVFEHMSSQYIMLKNKQGELPFKVLKIGRWWGNNPAKKREEEIDLIGINMITKQAIFGECKYKNAVQGTEILTSLVEKAELLPAFEQRYYILFSKSGFTQGLIEQSEKDAILVTLEDMYR